MIKGTKKNDNWNHMIQILVIEIKRVITKQNFGYNIMRFSCRDTYCSHYLNEINLLSGILFKMLDIFCLRVSCLFAVFVALI